MLLNEMANLNNVLPKRYEENYSNLFDGYTDKDNNILKETTDIDISLYKRLKKICLDDLEILESLGKGSFGEVKKAYWNDKVVAIKKAESHSEVKAFVNEVHHLARAFHENIIHLFGVAITVRAKYLIMEYADGGSLYHFLHNPPYPRYNIVNALSWLMQCARAIDYLHSYQPKAIIHRDLKSLNMLLKSGRKILKICDFGTACDQSTIMTDNKGSVAWMAPEVMSGKQYDEKCDVYSYGMFIWEILTRRIPGAEFTHQVRIMFQVLNNWRPPLIKGCPSPIQELMQRCWDQVFRDRPSMREVLQIITRIFQLVNGGEELVDYISSIESLSESHGSKLNATGSEGQTSHDVSEFPTDSTSDFHGNIQDSKKSELLHKESTSSSLIDFYNKNYNGRPVSESASKFCDGSSNQEEDDFDPYEPIAIFKDELSHVPRPVFRDRCPENIGKNVLIPLNINIPGEELLDRKDSCPTVPKTSKMDVKISPKPSTIFPSNFPTVSYHSKFLPVPNQTANLHSQSSFPISSSNRCDSCQHTPLAEVPNCFGHELNLNGSYYKKLAPHMRHHDVPQDPMVILRRRSAEVSQVDGNQGYGHRRSSSYESGTLIGFEPLEMEISNRNTLPRETTERTVGYGDCGQSMTKPVNRQLKNAPQQPTKECWPMVTTPKLETTASELGDLWQYLDEELKPAKAISSYPQSQKIYENHKEMAHDLLVVQEKIFYLNQSKKELLELCRKQEINHKSSKQRYHNRITDLEQTNQNLRHRQHELKSDLEQIQEKRRQQDQSSKPESTHNHSNDHIQVSQSYQRHHNQHSQGHTPYCKCYENVQTTHQDQRDSYAANPTSAQSQSHISHCSYNSYYNR